MTPPDAPDLDSIRALCDAATPGPWIKGVGRPDNARIHVARPIAPGARTQPVADVYDRKGDNGRGRADAAFIAASRALLPQLCDAVERQMLERNALWGENGSLRAQLAEQAEARAASAGERALPEQFRAWVNREIPPGTVISNPDWWAPKMWRAAMRSLAALRDDKGETK